MAQYVVALNNVFVVDAFLIGPGMDDPLKGIRPMIPEGWNSPACENDDYYGERPIPTQGKPKLKRK